MYLYLIVGLVLTACHEIYVLHRRPRWRKMLVGMAMPHVAGAVLFTKDETEEDWTAFFPAKISSLTPEEKSLERKRNIRAIFGIFEGDE